MTARSVSPPPFGVPFLDGLYVAPPWQAFFTGLYNRLGATVDKVDAAYGLAAAATPMSTEIVAGPGLHVGGPLGSNVGLTLYKVVTTVALLPTSGNAAGDMAYARDGRKPSEGVGAGTGVPCWWTPGAPGTWCAFDSGAAVVA